MVWGSSPERLSSICAKCLCCYCSQRTPSLMHLSGAHYSKNPDLCLIVRCQIVVLLYRSLFSWCAFHSGQICAFCFWSQTPTAVRDTCKLSRLGSSWRLFAFFLFFCKESVFGMNLSLAIQWFIANNLKILLNPFPDSDFWSNLFRLWHDDTTHFNSKNTTCLRFK